MAIRKRVIGVLSRLLGLTVFIDEVRYGCPDRTPRDV